MRAQVTLGPLGISSALTKSRVQLRAQPHGESDGCHSRAMRQRIEPGFENYYHMLWTAGSLQEDGRFGGFCRAHHAGGSGADGGNGLENIFKQQKMENYFAIRMRASFGKTAILL